jgi:glycosyltransferase involved in cell wall biosynthesis
MKILHVIDSLEIGGAEKLVAQLCRLQRKQSDEVLIYCLEKLGFLGKKLVNEGFKVELGRGTSLPFAFFNALSVLRRHSPDIVHCHNATATIIAAAAARLIGIQNVVSTRHGLVAPPHNLRQELKFGLAARYCNWIVAVCEQAKCNLQSLPLVKKEQIVCIYNGTAPIRRVPGKPSTDGRFTILHVGRLTAAKDQTSLLIAFAVARSTNPKFSLIIVGDGALRHSLENLAVTLGIGSDVSFTGEQTDVASYYSCADLFVMSSISEGLPISLLEAMSIGLPAVVTRVGGMPEVIEQAGAGVVVPASAPEELAAAIVNLSRRPDLLESFRLAGLNAYEDRYTPERMEQSYRELYLNCNENSRPATSRKLD